MRSRATALALVAALVVALSGSVLAANKGVTKNVAVGTITSIDNNQVVISEKVKSKEQPMTFKLNASTKKMGNLVTGSSVRIQYRTENNQNVATAIPERGAKAAKAGGNAKRSLTKEKKS
jgi:hypothetical protein